MQSGQDEAAGSQSTRQWMARARANQVGTSCDDSGLGPTHQFVGAERHQRRSVLESLMGGRFTEEPRRRTLRDPRTGGVEQT